MSYPVSVKALLWRGNSVLFLKNPRGEWELPGGRPELGETEMSALIREVLEECELQITSGTFLNRSLYEVIPGKRVLIILYQCTYLPKAGVNLSDEHVDAAWLPITESRRPEMPEFYWSLCQQYRQRSH